MVNGTVSFTLKKLLATERSPYFSQAPSAFLLLAHLHPRQALSRLLCHQETLVSSLWGPGTTLGTCSHFFLGLAPSSPLWLGNTRVCRWAQRGPLAPLTGCIPAITRDQGRYGESRLQTQLQGVVTPVPENRPKQGKRLRLLKMTERKHCFNG